MPEGGRVELQQQDEEAQIQEDGGEDEARGERWYGGRLVSDLRQAAWSVFGVPAAV
jgi:hypothetical protein